MVELRREKSRICVSPTIWTMTLELARLFGWTPLGTRRSDETGQSVDAVSEVRHLLAWQTEYVSSDGQTITAEDANQLAHSLNLASSDGGRIISNWVNGQFEPPALMRTPSTGFRWFETADGKNHLHKLAKFCQLGAFQIF